MFGFLSALDMFWSGGLCERHAGGRQGRHSLAGGRCSASAGLLLEVCSPGTNWHCRKCMSRALYLSCLLGVGFAVELGLLQSACFRALCCVFAVGAYNSVLLHSS